jgi:predicted ribosomally synthesized peptide with nif11-like leader
MAQENVAKLFRATQKDPELKAKFNAAPNLETFLEMAAEHGYDFTIEEWQEMTGFTVEELPGEISEIPGI